MMMLKSFARLKRCVAYEYATRKANDIGSTAYPARSQARK